MARSEPQINIRVPEELIDQIRDAMLKSGRSLTGEIVFRLYQSFSGRDPADDRILKLTERFEAMQAHYDDVMKREQDQRMLNESKIRALEKALNRLESKR